VSRKPTHSRHRRAVTSSGDWRVYRPAIWLAFIGVALLLVVNLYAGILILGAAIGVGGRITAGRRRRARGLPVKRTRRR
jgi:hypothetical protein